MTAKDEAAPAPDAPKKGKKLLLIVVALAAALMLVAALVLWALLSLNKGDGGEDEDEEDVQEVASSSAPPISVALDSFTVNLAHTPDDGDRYVQLMISLEAESPEADAAIKARMPRIRNNVVLIVSGKTAAELMTREGKEALAKEIKDGINRVVNPAAKGKKPNGPVVDVLFTSFIIQ